MQLTAWACTWCSYAYMYIMCATVLDIHMACVIYVEDLYSKCICSFYTNAGRIRILVLHTLTHSLSHTHTHSPLPPPHAYTHANTLTGLSTLPHVTLGFEQSLYNVSEDDRPFPVCVKVTKGQLEDRITLTISISEMEAKGTFVCTDRCIHICKW